MNTGRNVKELVLSSADALSAVRHYLEDLRDTGVDGLPYAASPELPAAHQAPAAERLVVQEAAATPAPQASVAPTVATIEPMDAIMADLHDCRRCELGEGRTNLVFGVGNPKARLVFVGEAPGRDEDMQGVPFVGEAGQLLTKIIVAMGFDRDDVYICNVLKCRPPNNRNPLPPEIEACSPFLLRQIKATGAEAIVALGTFAAQTLLNTKEPISRLRGRFHDYHGVPLMPTFHPAFLLRNAAMKREVWEDMQKVMKLLGMTGKSKEKSQ